MIDQVIRGLATTSMETLDQFITEEVTNHLFEDKKVPFSGLDLVALNLQRGEEHTLHDPRVYGRIISDLDTRNKMYSSLL